MLPQGLGGPWELAVTLVGLLGPDLGVFLGASLLVLCVMLGERSPPHLFLYILLFKRKTKWKQARTLPVVRYGESKFLLNKHLKCLNFFYLFFTYIIFYC